MYSLNAVRSRELFRRRYDDSVMTRRSTTAEALPRGVRVALNALIILGVFAMHNLLLGSNGEVKPHHEMLSMSQAASETAHSGAVVMTEVVSSSMDGMQGAMSDCGGLMALCLALVLGVSAYIVLRKRLADRVLWQLPPPTITRSFAVVPPFNSRSPLERSSILRC